jgi:Icc-related predicted phosphoesterase
VKLHILSDLHLEVADFDPPVTDADVVVLAGDIAKGVDGIDWALERFRVPVVYVPGNHEYYHHDLALLASMRERARGTRVHLLDRQSVVLGGVTFLGATLWTDFELFGDANTAFDHAREKLPDFRVIREDGGPLSPERASALHRRDRAWLAGALASGAAETVVVTHHAPHRGSLAERFATSPLSPAFVSDLDALMGRAPLWIHGHTHTSFDYVAHSTRVVCNPRGYAERSRPDDPENADFEGGLVVDLAWTGPRD